MAAPAATASSLPLRLPGIRGPKGVILVQLKRTPGLTARELASAIGSSLNAARHHLKELEADDLVEFDRRHHGVGAPAFVYRLSTHGETLFPRRYEAALLECLEMMESRVGRSAAVGVVEGHFRRLAAELAPELAGAPAERRLTIVAASLSQEGFMAEWHEQHDGSFATLTEHNCAVKAVAERYPELCQAEVRFLETVLQAPVERQAHMLGGCGACEYRVSLKPVKDVEETA
jgi:DeoR family transcriptional regulator, suf operon transcriptional repressor